jgi:hypothetical protein
VKIFSCLAFAGIFLSLSPEKNVQEVPDVKKVINNLLAAVPKIETLKWNLKVIERIKGKPKPYGSSVKLKLKPRKLYINIKGTEVLWVSGENNGKALVNPNSFPYVNLNLDPMGSLMRQDQHHTINEMGFNYLSEIIKQFVLRAGDKFYECFKYEAEEEHNYQKCHKITINNPSFGFVDYKVLKGENIISIARKLYVGEYMILEANPSCSGYNDVKEGQVIKVPNSYAKFVIIYIDKLYSVPVGISVSDDKGLYEQYDYFFLQVNPKFDDLEFTKDYKEYKF